MHAPLKVFQIRKNFYPYLSEQTKKLIEVRNSWKQIAANNGYKNAEKIAKEIGKEIKKAVAVDRKNYFNKDFSACCDRSNAWKTAKVILGTNNNLAPSIVHITDASGNCNEVTNPGKLAEVFNTFFQEKVKKLRDMTDQTPLITPASRLRKWLSKRGSPPPPFELKEINSLQFRRILKKIKPKRTHGADLIDSNSLKIT